MTRHVHVSIALLSAALLAYQIILLQAFSSSQWYHFAYMVISVALLGFGASGTALTLARSWLLARFERVMIGAILVSAASMPVSLALSQLAPARFDSYLLFTDVAQTGSLVLSYLVLAVPFFSGALALGLVFVRYTDRMGPLYFANLLGSGAGGTLGLALLYVATPEPLAAATGLMATAAAGVLLLREPRWPAAVGWIGILGLNLVMLVRPPGLHPSQYKDLQRAMLMPGVEITARVPHPMGLVEIARSDLFRDAPGLSLAYRGAVPAHDLVFVNGDLSRSLGGRQQAALRDFTTAALPYVLDTRASVLVLGGSRPGAISQALEHGASRVTGVEPHGGIRQLLADGKTSEISSDPRVRIRAGEARMLLAGLHETYDLIVLPDVGTFAGTSGLTALQEQHDLTLESLGLMWRRLTANGAIAATVWVDQPARNPLRLLATMIEMLERNGIDTPREHLLAVRSWGTITLVASRQHVAAFSDALRLWSQQLLFDPLIAPGLAAPERHRYNALQDSTLFQAVDSLLDGSRPDLYRRYAFRIAPTTDDRPYFSQFIKWSRLDNLWASFGGSGVPFFELGTLIVALTLAQAAVVAFLLIVLPLVRIGWSGSERWWTLSYFGGLAVGFMFVEMVMIQRFTMYLGHPVIAVAFVFTVLLFSSGIGSLASSRMAARFDQVRIAAARVAIALVALLFVLSPVLAGTIGFALPWRLAIGVALLAPAAFLMGFPFPVGLRALSAHAPGRVPWAWAVNGCISVASAPAAVLLAAEWGAVGGITTGATMYGVAALSGLLLRRPAG